MPLRDFIIVGSGPAGAAAALQLASEDVLMLDVGTQPPLVPADFTGNLNVLRKEHADLFPHLIGEKFQGLHNLCAPVKRNLKLKSPYLDYIVSGFDTLTPVEAADFAGDISLAKGGLANAWGAGLFRFTDADLDGFPIQYADLAPYYDQLTSHIGISGDNDDLAPWFHHDASLLPPIKLSRIASGLFERYKKKRRYFLNEKLHIGLCRIGVLTAAHMGRTPYAYENMEFFYPEIPAVYTPVHTLNMLEQQGLLDYRAGWLVESFEQGAEGVEVRARRIDSADCCTFRARHLLLAAGAINTARIVLRSRNDYNTRLPLLDNPLVAFPLFNLSLLGAAPDPYNASVGQLSCIYEGNPEIGTVQIAFYGVNGSLRSDVLLDLPVPIVSGRTFFKHVLSSFGLAMCFYPAKKNTGSYLQLVSDNVVRLEFETEPYGVVERKLMKLFRKVGYLSHPLFMVSPGKGSGLHYAGTLPMSHEPQGWYQCDPHGRLAGSNGVYIIDGACFSALPAKNLSLTLMANAMRIAQGLMR